MDVIKELIKKKDVDVEAKNIFGDNWTALHYAIYVGYFEAV